MSFLTAEKTEYISQKIIECKNNITCVKTDYLKRIFATKLPKVILITQLKLELNFISLFINNVSYINAINRN